MGFQVGRHFLYLSINISKDIEQYCRVLVFEQRNTEFYIYFGFKVKRACIQCVVPSIQRNASEPGNCAMFVIGQQKSVCNIFGFLALWELGASDTEECCKYLCDPRPKKIEWIWLIFDGEILKFRTCKIVNKIWKWKNSNTEANFEMSLNHQDQGVWRSGRHIWILKLKSFSLSPFFGLFTYIL